MPLLVVIYHYFPIFGIDISFKFFSEILFVHISFIKMFQRNFTKHFLFEAFKATHFSTKIFLVHIILIKRPKMSSTCLFGKLQEKSQSSNLLNDLISLVSSVQLCKLRYLWIHFNYGYLNTKMYNFPVIILIYLGK